MSIHEAIDILGELEKTETQKIPLYVGVARAGSDSPLVFAGVSHQMKDMDFGSPLHILVVPGALHQMEEEYLSVFAGYEPL